MSAYDEDGSGQPIAPVQPINRIQAMRALRVQQTRPYMGDRRARPKTKGSIAFQEEEMPAEPAVILDISPQAREQAHHLTKEAPNTLMVAKHEIPCLVNRVL